MTRSGTSYNKMQDRHNCHARINPDYAELIFSVLTLVLLLGVVVFAVVLIRTRYRGPKRWPQVMIVMIVMIISAN